MRKVLILISASLVLFASACKKQEEPGDEQLPNVTIESQHTVLLEPTVSIDCGVCPLAHHEIDQIEMDNENVTHMTHYLYGPLFHPYTQYLIDQINKTVFTPLFHVDRKHENGSVVYYRLDMFESILKDELEKGSAVDLKLTSQSKGEMIDLDIEVYTEAQDLKKEVLLTVVLVEKEVTGEGSGYDQRNYGNDDPDHPYYQQGDRIEGFVHTNVIRDVLTPFEGDMLDLSDGTAVWNASISINDLDREASAYRLIAFVTEDGDEVQPILNTVVGDLSD